MFQPALIASIAALLTFIWVIYLISKGKKTKQLLADLQVSQKNHEYLISNLRDIIDIAGFGSDMGIVVDVLTKSLEGVLPYSTISSIYLKNPKLIFRSQVKEAVNKEFINHIKDTMLNSINSSTKPAIQFDQNSAHNQDLSLKSDSIEEDIKGEAFDEMGVSEIKSTIEIKLAVNGQINAIINLSSTSAHVYSEQDRVLFSTISELVSGFLTRLNLLLNYEKSKSLAMIDSFSEGIIMLDQNLDLAFMNSSAKKFLNIQNSAPTILDILSSLPNTYDFKDKIHQCINGNQRIEENDILINNKMFKVVLTPVLEVNSPSKNTIGASILLHDITLEKSLAQTKEDFTNVMVHELRSPLTAIKASSEFLTSQADLTDEEKKRLIEMISISSKKMLDEISLILDSAKMDAGMFTIRKTEADIKKLITDRIAVFTPLAAEKAIGLKVEVDSNIPIFSFDPVRIDEVINNLLSNSLKFTPENGTISILASLELESIKISVTDTGQGIEKDKQSKLFSKYQQAPADSAHAGTGLGLYVVKQVVEEHGGTILLDSEVGRGTTVSFTLPLHSVAKKTLPEAVHASSENPQKALN